MINARKSQYRDIARGHKMSASSNIEHVINIVIGSGYHHETSAANLNKMLKLWLFVPCSNRWQKVHHHLDGKLDSIFPERLHNLGHTQRSAAGHGAGVNYGFHRIPPPRYSFNARACIQAHHAPAANPNGLLILS